MLSASNDRDIIRPHPRRMSMSTSSRLFMRFATIAAGAAAVVTLFPQASRTASGQSSATGDGIGTAKFTTDGGVANFSANADTIPYWRSSFTDPTNGATYPFTMVGTNPADGDLATTVPTVIIPLDFTFVSSADPNTHALRGTDRVLDTVGSPMFQNDADIGAAANATASHPPDQPRGAPAPRRPRPGPGHTADVARPRYHPPAAPAGPG